MTSISRHLHDPAPTRDAPCSIEALVAREACAGAPPGVDLAPWLAWLRATYADELAAVLLYGSVLSPTLRQPTSTPDFIVVTDSGRVPAHGLVTRALHGLLAPTSRSAELDVGGGAAVFKYLHLDLAQLAATTGPRLRDLFVAGRLGKQVRILYIRDAAARDAVLAALVASARALAPVVAALLSGEFDRARWVHDSLAVSYRGEWRIEAPDKVERLARAGADYYGALYGATLDALVRRGDVVVVDRGSRAERYRATADARSRRRARALLRRTRWRAALRWPKHALTVRHAGELVAGKLERAHPGLHIGRFARRHPILCALPIFLWLLWRGVLRSRGASPSPRAPALALVAPAPSLVAPASSLVSPPRPPAPAPAPAPRVALIANLGARGVARHGFDAATWRALLGAADVHPIASWSALPGAVAATRGADALIVLGGDGTLAGVVTELLRQHPERMPALVPLCGGGFNHAARVLGARRSPWRDLARVARHLREGRAMCERAVRVLRVDDPAHAEPTRYGFVFGSGVVYEYSRFIASHGGTGWWNSVRKTVRLTLGGLVGTPNGASVWRRFPAALALDGAALPDPAFSAVCACAVVARSAWVKPLPVPRPATSGTFVFLASALPRRALLRSEIVGVLRGTCRSPEHRTGHAATLRLASASGYLLDGELVAPTSRARELTVSAGPAVRFWLMPSGRGAA